MTMSLAEPRPALEADPSPAPILEIGMGFWASKTLLSAVELGLFTELAAGPKTGAELERALGLHPRATYDFLDALVALGLLARRGDGAERALHEHARHRPLSRPRQPALCRRPARNGEQPALSASGPISPRRCGPASRRTRSSTAASRCSTSSTPIRRGSSSSWTR